MILNIGISIIVFFVAIYAAIEIHSLFVGMKNWHPFLKDELAKIKQKGYRNGIGIVLAPQRSCASFDKYVQEVDQAKAELNAPEMNYTYVRPWFDHPRFVRAQAEQIRRTLNHHKIGIESVLVVFCVHAIPMMMAEQSRYPQEFERSSELVAKELGVKKWYHAYQSRTGDPRDPWTGPDVVNLLSDLKKQGEGALLLVPIGFVSDNAEVLYDLDIEVKAEAERYEMTYLRASTVMSHPEFVGMLVNLVQEEMSGVRV